MTIIYGIKNCDTMKKAMRWLDENNISYQFHDYRKNGLEKPLLELLEKKVGWQTLLNKRGTTWRKLDDNTKSSVDRNKALTLMLAQPAMIKRPVLVNAESALVGFSLEQYQQIFIQS